jgi:hypothetical protein
LRSSRLNRTQGSKMEIPVGRDPLGADAKAGTCVSSGSQA